MSARSLARRSDYGIDVSTYFDGADPPEHFTVQRNAGPRTYTFGCPCGKTIERSTSPSLGGARAVEAFARDHAPCARHPTSTNPPEK